MAEIINTFKENAPAMRFIGKKYPDFGGWWGEWFANGWFDQIEQAMGGVDSILQIWENGGGYVGLEQRCENAPFAYWIGMFTPANTLVPQGFDFVDFPAIGIGFTAKKMMCTIQALANGSSRKTVWNRGWMKAVRHGPLRIAYVPAIPHPIIKAMSFWITAIL